MSEALKFSVLTGAILLGFSLSAAPAALAQGGPGDRGVSFEELDADGDGVLTEAEMQAHRAARFAAMDTDGNGSLSATELTAAAEQRKSKRADRMIERVDADGDGEVSRKELASLGQRKGGRGFEQLDADGDGTVTKAEFEAAKEKRRAQMQKRRQQHDG